MKGVHITDLVIDDSYERYDLLVAAGLPPQDHIWITNIIDAIYEVSLSLKMYERIWFDHDLDGDNVMEVIRIIEEDVACGAVPAEDVPYCIVHTMNPVGRANITAVFKRWNIDYQDVHLHTIQLEDA